MDGEHVMAGGMKRRPLTPGDYVRRWPMLAERPWVADVLGEWAFSDQLWRSRHSRLAGAISLLLDFHAGE